MSLLRFNVTIQHRLTIGEAIRRAQEFVPEMRETVTANFTIGNCNWQGGKGIYQLSAIGESFTLFVTVTATYVRISTSVLPANILAMKPFYEPGILKAGKKKFA